MFTGDCVMRSPDQSDYRSKEKGDKERDIWEWFSWGSFICVVVKRAAWFNVPYENIHSALTHGSTKEQKAFIMHKETRHQTAEQHNGHRNRFRLNSLWDCLASFKDPGTFIHIGRVYQGPLSSIINTRALCKCVCTCVCMRQCGVSVLTCVL